MLHRVFVWLRVFCEGQYIYFWCLFVVFFLLVNFCLVFCLSVVRGFFFDGVIFMFPFLICVMRLWLHLVMYAEGGCVCILESSCWCVLVAVF